MQTSMKLPPVVGLALTVTTTAGAELPIIFLVQVDLVSVADGIRERER